MNERNNIIKHFIAKEAKILIVDDSNVTLKIEKDLMKTYGMNISTAKSGSECINLLKSNRYDIIFMDHVMPGMDGIETTKKIRKMNDEYFKNVVIIALTANTSPNICSMYIKNGFNDFLEKPIEISKLNKFLRTYLPRKYIVETNITEDYTKEFNSIEIQGVDTEKAIQNCGGNINNYLSLLSVAYYDGKNKINILRDFANNNDIENYTIEVHALKTVAEIIGDSNLSALAKRHEKAGTSNDMKFILENVNFLLNSYDNLLNNIKSALPEESTNSSPKITNYNVEDLLDLIGDTANAIDNFDLDSANESLNLLLNYNLSNSQISLLQKVKSYMNVFDYDNAYELITNFRYVLYND
ncbi:MULTISPECIES: response regulator [unclassified Clostridium]|uniref:response regulator n=1 Tax=unclassified Clostridium TaxID=2614128 RepID=UPI0002981EDE|nr:MULTISPECIES: response regulator [unclassified Clostridium]EKQ53411.1 MAG: response regulator (CheY-like, AAA-type ATPase, and DNA-binding domain containing protein) [Clostridium sp. Maddingley MBC34-26]